MKTIALLLVACQAVSINRWDRNWDDSHPHPAYSADLDGFDGRWSYHREVPDRFDGPGSGDDQFMNSMLTKYAMEESTPDGHPTGKFFFSKLAALMAAQEITETHLGLKGDAKEDYINKYLDKTFEHFDTAADGKIETERMSGFFRFFCANMQINLH